MGSHVRKRVADCLLFLGPLTVQKCPPELLPPTALEEGNGTIFSACRKEGSLANTGKKETFLVSMVDCGNDMALCGVHFYWGLLLCAEFNKSPIR